MVKENISYMEKIKEISKEELKEIELLEKKYKQIINKYNELNDAYIKKHKEEQEKAIKNGKPFIINDEAINLYSKAKNKVEKKLNVKKNNYNMKYDYLLDEAFRLDNAAKINKEINNTCNVINRIKEDIISIKECANNFSKLNINDYTQVLYTFYNALINVFNKSVDNIVSRSIRPVDIKETSKELEEEINNIKKQVKKNKDIENNKLLIENILNEQN